MTVTAEGYIIVSDMSGNLYMVDADTLSTTKLGSLGQDTWYYASMMYDYNTRNSTGTPCRMPVLLRCASSASTRRNWIPLSLKRRS